MDNIETYENAVEQITRDIKSEETYRNSVVSSALLLVAFLERLTLTLGLDVSF